MRKTKKHELKKESELCDECEEEHMEFLIGVFDRLFEAEAAEKKRNCPRCGEESTRKKSGR